MDQGWNSRLSALIAARNARERDPFKKLAVDYTELLGRCNRIRARMLDVEREAQLFKHNASNQNGEVDQTAQNLGASDNMITVEELRRRNDKLEEELTASREEEETLQKELTAVTVKAQKLRSDLHTCQDEKKTAKRRLASCQQNIKARKEEIHLRTQEVKAAKGEAAAVRKTLSQSEQQIQQLVDENENLANAMMRDKMKMVQEFNKMNSICEGLRRENKRLQQEVADLQKQLSENAPKKNIFQKLFRPRTQSTEGEAEPKVRFTGYEYPPTKVLWKVEVSPESRVNEVMCTRGSSTLVTAGNDGHARIWDAARGAPRTIYKMAKESVLSVDMSSSCVVAGTVRKCYVWPRSNHRRKLVFSGHNGSVNCVRLAPNGRLAVTGGRDRSIKIWDVSNGECSRSLSSAHSICNCVAVGDGGFIVSGHKNKGIFFWDLRSGKMQKEMQGLHSGAVTSVCMGRGSAQVLSMGRDHVLNMVDCRSFSVLQTYRHPGFHVGSERSRACISPSGRYVAAGGSNGAVVVWNADTGDVEAKVNVGNSLICTTWSAKGLVACDNKGFMYMLG